MPISAAVAGHAAATNAATSAESSGKSAMFTGGPIFKPFVFVELPLPAGYTLVPDAGLHMNDDGVVVATMNNGSVNRGFIWYDELYAEGWQGPIEANSTPIALDDAGLAGINNDLEICGTRVNAGAKAFFLALTSTYAGTLTQIGSGYAGDVSESGVVVGTYVSGAPVAWSQIAGSPVFLPPLSESVGTAAHGVQPSGWYTPHIVGQSENEYYDVQAVVWYFDSGWKINALSNVADPDFATALDINDDYHAIGAIMDDLTGADDTVLWVYDSGWTGKSLGLADPFMPEAINDNELPEIVGEEYLWKATDLSATPIEGGLLDLMDLTLGEFMDDIYQMRCTDINSAGEIVGVAQLDDSNGDWIAFKLVPYDVDNDGQPDFREIIDGSEADMNENWLIDDGEVMRVGLHAPGYSDGLGHHIPYVQAVRLLMHLGILPVELSELEDEYALNGVLADDECSFREDIQRWTRGTAQYPKQREAIITLLSTLEGLQDLNHEYLPEDQEQWDDILANLREFGFKYARCIDWIQFGNESFGGSDQYKFRVDELGQGCGPAQETTYGQLSDACQLVAMDKILEWLDAQMWAALEGSALAGRPLRMIAAGLSAAKVYDGYESDNHERDETAKVADWVNQRQMYFDMHDIWTAVDEAAESPHRLMGTGGVDPPPWTPPAHAVSLEWRPRVNVQGEWYTQANRETYEIFRDDEGEDPNNPGVFCWEDLPFPLEVWDDFVVDWRASQFGPTEPFGMAEVLGALAGAGFTVACYGQTGMQQPSNMPYDMGCLIASHVCSMYLDANREPFSKATVAFDEFVGEDVAEMYWIDPFTPHDDACPQCPQ